MKMGVFASMVLGMVVSASQAAYTTGYTWDFTTLFNGTDGSAAYSMADSEGYRAFQYRMDGSLLAALHSWENPANWQPSGSWNNVRVYSTSLNADSRAVQIYWIAPIAGVYDLSVVADNISDIGGWATLQTVKVNGVQVGYADWCGTDAAATSYAWSEDSVALNAGDTVVYSMSAWGSQQGNVGAFSMSATLVPEPCTMGLLGVAVVGFLTRRK